MLPLLDRAPSLLDDGPHPTPLAPFGVRVTDLDVTRPLSPADSRRLRQIVLRHKLVALRTDRSAHTPAAETVDDAARRRLLLALSRAAGPAAPRTTVAPGAETPTADDWSVDGIGWRTPSQFVVLHAPAGVGPRSTSLFSDSARAYDALPESLRRYAERAWFTYQRPGQAPVRHPAVRLHPETGERLLLLGPDGESEPASAQSDPTTDLQRLLRDRLGLAHHVLRWDWAPGDLLLIDNRSVHVRHRIDPVGAGLQTTRIAGEAPLGLDGRHSFHPVRQKEASR